MSKLNAFITVLYYVQVFFGSIAVQILRTKYVRLKKWLKIVHEKEWIENKNEK